jgi:protein-L-isoaspartate(D-aspartate) O-methyltransferase
VQGDAVGTVALLGGAPKIVVTFAVASLPETWLDAIPEGGTLVAPVGARDRDQRLVRVRRIDGKLERSEHGAVRYVSNRSPDV